MPVTTESAYIGQVTGTIEETPTGLYLRCNSDRQLFPIRITGTAITMPLPKTPQCWSVLPNISSDGTLAALKTWRYDNISDSGTAGNSSSELWEFTGTVYQISSKSQLVTMRVGICVPRSQRISITLSTSAIAEFKVGHRWHIYAQRNQNRLEAVAATCLHPSPKVLTRSDLLGDLDKPAEERLCSTDLRCEPAQDSPNSAIRAFANSVSETVNSHHYQPQLPDDFEITLEAEVEGGWLRIPSLVVNSDPRWQRLTATGLLRAKWKGDKLVLTRLTDSLVYVQPNPQDVCCANCQFYQASVCCCEESALYNFDVDPLGRCPDFTQQREIHE